MPDGPPVDPDFVPPESALVTSPVLEGEHGPASPTHEERRAATLGALLGARMDLLTIVTVEADDLDWLREDGGFDLRVEEVLSGEGIAPRTPLFVWRPRPAGEACACQRPHFQAGPRYVVGLVRNARGAWEFARTGSTGSVWARVVDEGGESLAVFPRGGDLTLDSLRRGGV